ncbi:MFS transporter [Helicobacter turcicus]|uniref:MFS transporter n=1 Tax=Helicobacter turcicus TaxID=2867412 RepID=A0ABS7JNW1_9HELI|nr:MFS transporter [Helicobacter turcicus]MBX7491057.1 MFS transporter [Helicobacter turcicus]MBX7546318.1 MFS transporter [Helicobacter turcicus]
MAKESLMKQSLPLSLILGSRFFGLFIVMPILSLYTLSLPGSSPILVGIAMGGYALTQVLFQIPFGFLSDKFGRKSIIAIGLVIFALGSLVCALSQDIYMLILGRLLQGAGAIGGVISAMIADLVKEENRTKAMAFMGATISLSFTAALILGPILAANFGVSSLFWITTFLAVASLVLLFTFVPNAPKITYSFMHKSSEYGVILKNKNLQIMNLTNFLQKGFMTLALLVIPIALVKGFDMPKEDLWQVYIPASLLGFFAMIPAAILAEKKGKFKSVMVVGILFFVLSYLLMLSQSRAVFIFGVLVFFVGFSIHEPIMQSLASRYCKAYQKGSAMGVFTTFGYLGSFFGALLGGHLYEFFSILSIVIFVVIASFVWILIFGFLANPAMQKNLYLSLTNSTTNASLEPLAQLSGILEWYINESERVVVIKYDKHIIDEDEILEFIDTHLAQHFIKGE